MKVSVQFPVILFVLTTNNDEVTSKRLPISATANTMQLANQAGFAIEEYNVTTSDGYILKMYRLPAKRLQFSTKPLVPVIIIHGLIGTSSDFMVLGPKKSLAFLLVNAGYEVFLGNLRFNEYSSHKTLNKTDPAYWDFSLDEYGLMDVPAQIDKILNITKATKIHFIGYSLGSTAYIMMCDRRPDIAKRISSFVALAPAIHMKGMAFYAPFLLDFPILDTLASLGINQINLGLYQKEIASIFCRPRRQSEDLCYAILFLFVGEDYDQVDYDMVPSIVARMQPSSINTLKHYLQLAKGDSLKQFDFGSPERNIIKYGKPEPPEFNISANLATVVLFYGKNDPVTPAEEINKLINEYRNAKTLMLEKSIDWIKFNHYDFLYAKDLGKLVNYDVVKILNNITRSIIQNNKWW